MKMTAEAAKRVKGQQIVALIMDKTGFLIDAALRDTLGTQAHQVHRQGLEHAIDARIRYNVWYRRAWRAAHRAVEYIGWRAKYDAR